MKKDRREQVLKKSLKEEMKEEFFKPYFKIMDYFQSIPLFRGLMISEILLIIGLWGLSYSLVKEILYNSLSNINYLIFLVLLIISLKLSQIYIVLRK